MHVHNAKVSFIECGGMYISKYEVSGVFTERERERGGGSELVVE